MNLIKPFESRLRVVGVPFFQLVLILLIVLFAVVFVIVMFCEHPEWIFGLLGVSGQRYPKYEALKFLGIGMGGALFVLQVLMAYIRAKAMEETAKSQVAAATAQAKATEEQATANKNIERGRRQQRLKIGIEHLGQESASMRLGGAYELFHLAQDTKELRQTVLDIFVCSYSPDDQQRCVSGNACMEPIGRGTEPADLDFRAGSRCFQRLLY